MNRFTVMRQNVEAALAASTSLQALSVPVHAWSGERTAIMDDPKVTLRSGIRVDPASIAWEPWAMNATTRFTQTLDLVVWLPEQKGLKAEQLEEIVWEVCRALLPITRNTMATFVSGIEKVSVKGDGEIALADNRRDQSKPPKNADMNWSHVATVEIVHDVGVAEMALL